MAASVGLLGVVGLLAVVTLLTLAAAGASRLASWLGLDGLGGCLGFDGFDDRLGLDGLDGGFGLVGRCCCGGLEADGRHRPIRQLDELRGAAGRLDLLAGALGEGVGDDEEGSVDLAATEDLDRLAQGADEAGRAEQLAVDGQRRALGADGRQAGGLHGCLGFREAALLGVLRDAPHVDDFVGDLERVLEAAQLRHAAMDGRLAALEAGRDGATGPRLLTLRATAGGLALAGGDAAADTRPRGRRAGRRSQIMELHAWASSSSVAVSAAAFVPAPLVPAGGDLLDGDQEADSADLAAHGRVVDDLDRLADPMEADGPQRAVRASRVADGALVEGHTQLTGHRRPPRPAGSTAGR